MHRAPGGETYAFVSTTSGTVRQFELDGSTGTLTGTPVRTLTVGSQVEGMVADDQTGSLYLAEEDVGIWKYGADPAAGSARTQVDRVAGGRLTADVEGLTIYYGPNGTGYLIASSQGNSTYAVYDRGSSHAYRGSFTIVSGNGIDGVSGTDGLEVTDVALGAAFPSGMLVVHDASNSGGTTSNYKFVPWDDVAALGGLMVDTSHDPQSGWLLE
jgi:3-phytase